MPIKWTPENDQILLLKILETSQVNADARAIAAAWPASDEKERPTPRAVTERLVKIRQLAKANGAGHFSVSSSQAKGRKSTSSAAGTPSKPRAPKAPKTPQHAPAMAYPPQPPQLLHQPPQHLPQHLPQQQSPLQQQPANFAGQAVPHQHPMMHPAAGPSFQGEVTEVPSLGHSSAGSSVADPSSPTSPASSRQNPLTPVSGEKRKRTLDDSNHVAIKQEPGESDTVSPHQLHNQTYTPQHQHHMSFAYPTPSTGGESIEGTPSKRPRVDPGDMHNLDGSFDDYYYENVEDGGA